MPLATIDKAIAAIARGEIVVVVDDEDRVRVRLCMGTGGRHGPRSLHEGRLGASLNHLQIAPDRAAARARRRP